MRKIVKNKKGINTILAALLMVVIVVVASVMVYAWSTGLLGSLMVTPQTGKEALNLESAVFPSNSNVTLYIRNTGSATVSFTTYYVKDPSGNTYSQPNFVAGPTIAPNAAATVLIGINTACPSCTAPSSSYTFSTGTSYIVTLVTSRNGQFVFTATKS